MQISRQYTVEGVVQGVFYRANTQKQAQALGLQGWVKNELDGSVTVYAYGEAAAVEALEQWLWVGPPAARVERVSGTDVDQESCQGFSVR